MESYLLIQRLLDDFSLCCFDFSGFGHSEGRHSTLGLKEQEDLAAVVEHVKNHFKQQTVYVWGRSMGAVTALLLAKSSDNSFCDGLVLDAPFVSTQKMVALIYQLCNVVPSIPNFILYLLFGPLGTKLKEITGHDVIDIDIEKFAKNLTIPACFFVTDQDTVSGTGDVKNLYDLYAGIVFSLAARKMIKIGKGAHNEERNLEDFEACKEFLLSDYKSRVEQGFHDERKNLPVDEIEENTRKNSLNTDRDDDPLTWEKPLSELILDSQREVTSKKIQIAPNLSLFNSKLSNEKPEEPPVKIAYEDLDESMMELSQQVEDMMTKQQQISPKLKPTSYSIHKLGNKSTSIQSPGIQSPGTINPREISESHLSGLIINTPFAIQTKTSKK